MRPSYLLSRLDYTLPPELIAQQPLPERGASRLLHVNVAAGRYEDRRFAELPELLPPQALIVLNDSRVIPARMIGARAAGASGQGGGRVEVLFLRYIADGVCEAVVGSNAKLAAGESIALPGGWSCELLEGKSLDGVRVRYLNGCAAPAALSELLAYLEAHGAPPLPPYIKRDVPREADIYDAIDDKQRYQTVYARHEGSAAAPTAGLHFDEAMLERLRGEGHTLAGATLHVGLGTFAPVRERDLRDHVMHEEAYSVEAEAVSAYAGALRTRQPVLAVGTTSLRVLHTIQGDCRGEAMLRPYVSRAADNQGQGPRAKGEGEGTGNREQGIETPRRGGPWAARIAGWKPALPEAKPGFAPTGAISGMTDAFIYPGQGTDACDLLLTNFHLPRSTLLALVYAFGGEELMRGVYHHAVEQRYRFFSYGDCMLIDRRNSL